VTTSAQVSGVETVESAPDPNTEAAPSSPRTRPSAESMRAALHRMPLRARVSALVMVTVGLTLAIASIVSYAVVRNEIVNRLDSDLEHSAQFISSQTNLARPDVLANNATVAGFLSSLNVKESIVGANADGSFTVYKPQQMTVLENGQPVTVDASAPAGAPEEAVAAGQSAMSLRTAMTSDGRYRVIALHTGDGYALVLATSMASTQATLTTLGWASVLIGLAGIAIAGTAGSLVGRAALRPVERLTVATEYIARTGDLRRIEVSGDDELARLTTSFNTMLAALARSQDYQKRLVADAGHELRTPLTSIRTNLDLLAQAMAEPDNPRLSAQDRADLMSDVRAQMEELSLLISDLVELSRDERPAHAVEQIDFAEVVERAVQRVQRRAPSLTYDVRIEPWRLQGDPAALERAVTNLLDNAAKWSPPGGTVSVLLENGALQVADQGPGIAEEDLALVFERFYRSPEARTMPGSGLGLAIVRQIAENHGGRVAAARAAGGGALLGVWLPGRPDEASAYQSAQSAQEAAQPNRPQITQPAAPQASPGSSADAAGGPESS
jgi:two-component system sensor histidine kinase MprB